VNSPERGRGRLGGRALAAGLVLALGAASACSAGGAKDRTRRQTDIYVAVLRAVLPPVSVQGVRPVVFVSPFDDGKPFSLEVQAGVIAKLSKQAQVKFVDEQIQAVDAHSSGAPVLDNAVLFSLGAVPSSGEVVELRGEQYRTAAERAPLRFVVRATSEGWLAQLAAATP
jgi:hypothetical protein